MLRLSLGSCSEEVEDDSREREYAAGKPDAGRFEAEFMIWGTEGTRAMGGGISSRSVTAHADLPTAEGCTVVIEVPEFGIHGPLDMDKGILAVPDGVVSVITVRVKIIAVVECTSSVLRTKERGL